MRFPLTKPHVPILFENESQIFHDVCFGSVKNHRIPYYLDAVDSAHE
jgi:hypothetical protein